MSAMDRSPTLVFHDIYPESPTPARVISSAFERQAVTNSAVLRYSVSPHAHTMDVARLSPSQRSDLCSHDVPPVLRKSNIVGATNRVVMVGWSAAHPFCTSMTGCRVGIVWRAWIISSRIILAFWPLNWRLQSQAEPALNGADSPPG
ncbi:hypothetical protein PILCRDRAFT_827218 [Piloderma croceum F 1598]|uniref:Uncharacterized protein n=1 Tax=Piloderma croceum (strain F 1598) TaxID=765440 RepID=A0A0C3ESF9_PILCF|nr:hypothetical protein PILCRDRAFT_827218 [Piloderma croceum F 1598]